MNTVTLEPSFESLEIDAPTRRILEKFVDAIPLAGDAFTGEFVAIAKRSVLDVVGGDNELLQGSLKTLLNASLAIEASGNCDGVRLLRTVWESNGDVIFGVDPVIVAWVGRQSSTF